jgi:CRISPR-associated protein Cas5d
MADVVRIRFEGEFGCFTRPEFAAERYSYDLPPPTAARGMVESILWKPEIAYHVRSVSVVPHSSGRRTRMMRLATNEVGTLSPSDTPTARTQRRCLILRDPAFVVEVEIHPGSRAMSKPGHNLKTYREMLERRVTKGQCVETPCLGLRDYPAKFSLAGRDDQPIDEDRVLGPMTYLIWRRDNWPGAAVRDRATEMAVMLAGVVDMREWAQ